MRSSSSESFCILANTQCHRRLRHYSPAHTELTPLGQNGAVVIRDTWLIESCKAADAIPTAPYAAELSEISAPTISRRRQSKQPSPAPPVIDDDFSNMFADATTEPVHSATPYTLRKDHDGGMAAEITEPCDAFLGLTFVLNPAWIDAGGDVEAQRIVTAIESLSGVVSTNPKAVDLTSTLLVTENGCLIAGESCVCVFCQSTTMRTNSRMLHSPNGVLVDCWNAQQWVSN